MAKGLVYYEQDFIATAQAKTGHTVEEWMDIIRGSGIEPKQNTILKWLKATHGMNHTQATYMAGIYLNGGQAVYDYAVLMGKLFEGKATLLEWEKEIERCVLAALGEYDPEYPVEFLPTKNTVSVEGKKIFACVTPTKSTLRVGLDLGDQPFDKVVQKVKGLGAMPNLTHMIEINSPADINDALIDYFGQAYHRVHGKGKRQSYNT
jgi:hypothetical protein